MSLSIDMINMAAEVQQWYICFLLLFLSSFRVGLGYPAPVAQVDNSSVMENSSLVKPDQVLSVTNVSSSVHESGLASAFRDFLDFSGNVQNVQRVLNIGGEALPLPADTSSVEELISHLVQQGEATEFLAQHMDGGVFQTLFPSNNSTQPESDNVTQSMSLSHSGGLDNVNVDAIANSLRQILKETQTYSFINALLNPFVGSKKQNAQAGLSTTSEQQQSGIEKGTGRLIGGLWKLGTQGKK